MKDTPIIILNKDRLEPLKKLVESLKVRNYNNITIIDNESTYEKLLNWYKESGLDVFYNNIPETKYDTGTLYRLAFEIKHEKFVKLLSSHYVFTDSDVVPIDECPEDFIESLIDIRERHNCHKVGLGLKIDDLPENDFSKGIIKNENFFWLDRIQDDKYEIYKAGVDTTFAIYAPNSLPLLNHNVIRSGGKLIARHIPWYYDLNNLPEDEMYYLRNLAPNRGPGYSMEVKKIINA